MSATPEQRDGRTVRAERTRQALVDSLLALLEEGQRNPTAAEIAARAGVSERSVFQHFPDREALFEAVAREQYDRVMPTLRPIDSSLPLPERVEQFSQQRGAPLRAHRRRAPRRAADRARVDVGGRLARRPPARPRRPRPSASSGASSTRSPPRSASRCRAALIAHCSWSAWESWRTHQRLGVARARAALRRRHRARYCASADSSSGIAWSACSKRTARHAQRPGGLAVGLEVVDEQALARRAGRRRAARASARRWPGSGLRMPTKAESTTSSKISSSSGSFARQSGSHSRTLLVSSAVRSPRPRCSPTNSIIGAFGLDPLEVELAQPGQVEAVVELLAQAPGELLLGDLAALERDTAGARRSAPRRPASPRPSSSSEIRASS